MKHIRPALTLLVAFTLLFGLVYPYAITGVAQALMPAQANGSLIEREGRVIGSSLIGQPFVAAGYLQPRPSAAGEGYDASASSGSNLGPTSAKLAERLKTDADALRAAGLQGHVPADAVTTSGSGLDPHISPAFARSQAVRIAAARGVSPDAVLGVIDAYVEGRLIGFIGEPRVNVLAVNLALDRDMPVGR